VYVSNYVQGLVWNAEIPNANAKIIAVKLADWSNDYGGSIFPAIATEAQMTALSRSTVCKWHYALESCGLLKVVTRSPGGARKTTERAFDLDLLRSIAWDRSGGKKVPPTSKLVEKTIERLNTANAQTRTVKVTVFEVVPFATIPHHTSEASAHMSTVRYSDGSSPIDA
jgi:hypothetical protein